MRYEVITKLIETARKTNRDEICKLIIPMNTIVLYSYDTN